MVLSGVQEEPSVWHEMQENGRVEIPLRDVEGEDGMLKERMASDHWRR